MALREYSRRQEERINRTPEGREALAKIKEFKKKPLREKIMTVGGYMLRRLKK